MGEGEGENQEERCPQYSSKYFSFHSLSLCRRREEGGVGGKEEREEKSMALSVSK